MKLTFYLVAWTAGAVAAHAQSPTASPTGCCDLLACTRIADAASCQATGGAFHATGKSCSATGSLGACETGHDTNCCTLPACVLTDSATCTGRGGVFSTTGPFACTNQEIDVGSCTRGALGCTGDCDGNGAVTIDEIILGSNIALELRPLNACSTLDRDGSGAIEIDELIIAVDFALNGCPVPPTPNATPDLPTTMPTPAAPCEATADRFVDCLPTSGLDVGAYGQENGAAVADIDADGFPDIFFWTAFVGAWLSHNLGHDMQFAEITGASSIQFGPHSVAAAAFGDLDNDGRPDLVVSLGKADEARWFRDPFQNPLLNTLYVYHNLGQNQFEEVSDRWGFRGVALEPVDGTFGFGLSLVDLNLDGRLDVVEYRHAREVRPLIFLSQADGLTWQEAGRDIFGNAHGPTWNMFFSDANDDHLQDVFMLNDSDQQAPSRHYLRLDRSLRFEEQEVPAPDLRPPGTVPLFGTHAYGSPMGAATADLNGDGKLEMVISDTGDQHVLSLGRNVEVAWGVKQNPNRFGIESNCWSVAIVDLENDGKPDIFITCAGYESPQASFALRNSGGKFDVAAGVLPGEDMVTSERGLAVADFDQDGRLDLLTGGDEAPPRLLWNRIPGGGSLAIRLKGTHTNAQGIGARVQVDADGLPTQVREMFPGGATWGYSDAQLIFGLGQATHAKLTVDWRPAGGTAVQVFDVGPGTRVIEEP